MSLIRSSISLGTIGTSETGEEHGEGAQFCPPRICIGAA